MRDKTIWDRLVRKVAVVVAVMPLWKLQTVGRIPLEFLYANTGNQHEIELKIGVAYCFRKFHALMGDMVRGAWLRFVRQQNLALLGETADLNEFLFGSERNNLAVVRPVLMDIQRGRCLYCGGGITGPTAHVDHSSPGADIRPTWRITSCWPTTDAILRNATDFPLASTYRPGLNGTQPTAPNSPTNWKHEALLPN
jgi:hypothetical protein